MRKSIFCLFSFLVLSLFAYGQSGSIIDDLNTNKAGQGNVIIYQDAAISRLLGTKVVQGISASDYFSGQLDPVADEGKSIASAKSYIRIKGFRIQAYSGNNQKQSKNEAEARKSAIRSSFPNMDVTVTYSSPVWRVKAGHFQTREQAQEAMERMKVQFPSFGRELYIINDEIKIPVD